MDPHSFNEGLTDNIVGHIYEQLARRNRQQEMEPALAESWTVVNDTTWRFTMRAGVKFSDGSAAHRRRRGVLDRACATGQLAAGLLCTPARQAHADRRAHVRAQAGKAQPAAAGAPAQRAHHERRLVQGQRRGAGARLHQEGGRPLHAQRDGHRAVRARALRARHPRHAGQEPGVVGPLRRQRDAHRLHTDRQRQHAHGRAAVGRRRFHPRHAPAGSAAVGARGQRSSWCRGPRTACCSS